MAVHRRRFCPRLDDSLESRAVMAQVLPLPAAVAILHGTQLHPSISLKKLNPTRTPTYQYANTPNKFTFKAKLDRSAIPSLTAQERANSYLNTYVVTYKNGTPNSFPWASITEKLDHGLRYVAGTAIQPPATKLTSSIDSNGVQTLNLVFPYGIPTGSQGVFAFQTKYTSPPYNNS